MISRYKIRKDDILYSKQLNCYPAEDQASKIFIGWLQEHPEYSLDDIRMRIDSYEREEDYYGHGGGYDRYVRIYINREETDSEYEERIRDEEEECFNSFKRDISKAVSELIKEMSIYPNLESKEINDKHNEITDSIMEVVSKSLKECSK